jgi:hypothetical protein
MCCEPYELDPTSIEERAGTDKKGVGSVLRQTCEGSIDLTRRARGKDNEFQAVDVRRRLRIFDD